MTNRDILRLIVVCVIELILLAICKKIDGSTGLIVFILGTVIIIRRVNHIDKAEEAQKKSNQRFIRCADELKAVCEKNAPPRRY